MLHLPNDHQIHLWYTKQSNVDGSLADQKKQWRQATHQWIKASLMEFYGLSPESAQWEYKSSGQPFFSHFEQPLHISISHSYEYSAFTLSEIPAGVDVEKQLPRKNLSALWQHLNFGEESTIDSATFYRLWTQLESYTKALGSNIWETQAIASQLLTLERNSPFYHGKLNQAHWQFFQHHKDQTEISVAVQSKQCLQIVMAQIEVVTSVGI